MISAFGIDHGTLSKRNAQYRERKKATGGRYVAGALAPGVHGLIAGRPGHRLQAASNEVAGGVGMGIALPVFIRGNYMNPALAGVPIGAALGVHRAQKKGHYVAQREAR